MPRDTPYSGVAAMFRSSIEREPPVVYEDGGQMRDFVHVDDANVAVALAVGERAPGSHAAYNVCSGRLVGVPVLGRFGAKADNPTLLDRPYWLGYAVIVAVVVGLAAMSARRLPGAAA